MAQQKIDFEGVVVRRDKDGFGIVQFDQTFGSDQAAQAAESGIFTKEVLQNSWIDESCTVGTKVSGRAEQLIGGFKVLHLEPTE